MNVSSFRIRKDRSRVQNVMNKLKRQSKLTDIQEERIGAVLSASSANIEYHGKMRACDVKELQTLKESSFQGECDESFAEREDAYGVESDLCDYVIENDMDYDAFDTLEVDEILGQNDDDETIDCDDAFM